LARAVAFATKEKLFKELFFTPLKKITRGPGTMYQ